MESKHRWYQCFERINHPSKSIIQIYRMYHHMYARKALIKINKLDLLICREIGIDPFEFTKVPEYPGDSEVLNYVMKHGVAYFKKIAIWDCRNE